MNLFLGTAIEAARKGGEIISSYFNTAVERTIKEDRSFVTKADTEAEKVIISYIKFKYPDHSFLSEENGADKKESRFEWVIDPLDGTANFLNGVPFFAVSIALLKDGALEAGVVYQPIGDSMFYAAKGEGTKWNGNTASVSDGDSTHAMMTVGPGKKEKDKLNKIFSNAEKFIKSKRYLGCTALELAYVARGGTEGFICLGLNKWDFAAGALLVQEAGGKITGLEGNDWDFGTGDYFIASNGKTHDALLSLVRTSI